MVSSATTSVAQLYKYVKSLDDEFSVGKPISSEVLNEDGTPKVLYHQTGADFSVFSTDHSSAGAHDSETPNGIFLKARAECVGRLPYTVFGGLSVGVDAHVDLSLFLNVRGAGHAAMCAGSGYIDR